MATCIWTSACLTPLYKRNSVCRVGKFAHYFKSYRLVKIIILSRYNFWFRFLFNVHPPEVYARFEHLPITWVNQIRFTASLYRPPGCFRRKFGIGPFLPPNIVQFLAFLRFLGSGSLSSYTISTPFHHHRSIKSGLKLIDNLLQGVEYENLVFVYSPLRQKWFNFRVFTVFEVHGSAILLLSYFNHIWYTAFFISLKVGRTRCKLYKFINYSIKTTWYE